MVNAERAVIGTLLMNNGEDTAVASSILKPYHFETGIYRAVYQCYLNAFNNGQTISLANIQEQVSRDSMSYELVEQYLRDSILYASSATFKTDCETVFKAWQVRQYKQVLNANLEANTGSITDCIARSIQSLTEIVETEAKANIVSLADIAKANRDSYFTGSKPELLHLPFPSIDNLVGGLEPGDLIIIAARPAVGKSAFVAQLALTFARQQKRIGFYSLEMKQKQLYERFLALASGINLSKIRGSTSFGCDEERALFEDGSEFLERKDNLFIIEGSKTVSEIKRESLYMSYDILIVDYLQLLQPEERYKGNRYAEVGEISAGLKDIAMSLNVPVIALSQLNRVATNDRPPSMAELRESGSLEQDASIVMLLWNKSPDGKEKGLKVDKSRQSKFGEVTLQYDGGHMMFREANGYLPPFKDDDFVPCSDSNDLPWED